MLHYFVLPVMCDVVLRENVKQKHNLTYRSWYGPKVGQAAFSRQPSFGDRRSFSMCDIITRAELAEAIGTLVHIPREVAPRRHEH